MHPPMHVTRRVTTGGYPYLWEFKGVGADPCVCPEMHPSTHIVLARSPDLARVLTIRSPSVQSVVLAVALPDLVSTGESREFGYILNAPIGHT